MGFDEPTCPDAANSRHGYRHIGAKAKEDFWVPCEHCKAEVRAIWEANGKTPQGHAPGKISSELTDMIKTPGGKPDRELKP